LTPYKRCVYLTYLPIIEKDVRYAATRD
jgi:hypothetical protein